MSTKLIECTLGVKYRQVHADALYQAAPCITSMGISKNAMATNRRTLGGIYALAGNWLFWRR